MCSISKPPQHQHFRFRFHHLVSSNRPQLDDPAEELKSRGGAATNAMTENGESCYLWFRERDHDIIIYEGDDDDDGLRYCYAKSTEKRDFWCTLVNYDHRGWERTTLEEGEMEILMGGTPHPDDWDEIYEMSWKEREEKEVEMDSMVFDDDARMEIMEKNYDKRKVSKEKGENKTKEQATDGETVVGTNFKKTEVK